MSAGKEGFKLQFTLTESSIETLLNMYTNIVIIVKKSKSLRRANVDLIIPFYRYVHLHMVLEGTDVFTIS
jgi:hypothetical protein